MEAESRNEVHLGAVETAHEGWWLLSLGNRGRKELEQPQGTGWGMEYVGNGNP